LSFWNPSTWFNKTTHIFDGFMPFRLWQSSPQFNDYTESRAKLIAALSNPALLKVICLQCDLFSMGKVYVYQNGKERESDPAIERMMQPNPMQQGTSQFLWDYMFWLMLGNSYLHFSSKVVDRDNAPMYWLEPYKMEWPLSLERKKDKMIFSQKAWNELLEEEVTYRYDDGTTKKIKLKDIAWFTDLSNGTGNWFKGSSRIDALTKIISNNEATLDADNINIRYSGKFIVAGQQDRTDVTKTPMGDTEKRDVEEKIDGMDKKVHAMKSMIDIKRFVDDRRALDLDKAYLGQYFLIGNMFGIPRDVLEAYQSSTFENQEKARASHVSYTLEPKSEMLCSGLDKIWGYNTRLQTKRIIISWDHLPFVQVFEKDRVSVKDTQVRVFLSMYKSGIPLAEINEFLDTKFTIDETKRQEESQQGGNGSPKKANN
jgi:hypothetical protein